MALDIAALRADLIQREVDVLRVIYPDVIGVTRSKDLLVSQLDKGAHNGPTFCQGVWVTSTRGDVLDAGGIASDGLQDLVTQIDASTIVELPWEPGVAYALGDAYNPDGTENQFSPRTVLRKVIREYESLGLRPVVGPELEFYIASPDGEGGWKRSHNQLGQVYTTGAMVDPNGTFLHLLRMVDQLNIQVFAGNHEFSPSQYEINLWHGEALNAADRTFLLKSAIKDVVFREGKLATFVGKPWSDEGGSGFHLHFSVTDLDGVNQMHDGGTGLSPVARSLIAGITANAAGLTALTNPTVNAYRRLGPDTLAPYRANWGLDNRSCMVRIPPERGAGTRLEIRVGDGAANPYLLIAGILAAGLDGIKRELVCPEVAEGMAYDNEAAEVLPMSLASALDALEANVQLRERLSPEVVETFVVMKRHEVEQYHAATGTALGSPLGSEVTPWEVSEYFIHY